MIDICKITNCMTIFTYFFISSFLSSIIGSGQQLVTVAEDNRSPQGLWHVRDAHDEGNIVPPACLTGAPVPCGKTIRLNHIVSFSLYNTLEQFDPLTYSYFLLLKNRSLVVTSTLTAFEAHWAISRRYQALDGMAPRTWAMTGLSYAILAIGNATHLCNYEVPPPIDTWVPRRQLNLPNRIVAGDVLFSIIWSYLEERQMICIRSGRLNWVCICINRESKYSTRKSW